MSEGSEPTEEDLERRILRALGGLTRDVERYLKRRRESREDSELSSDEQKRAALRSEKAKRIG